MNLIPQAIASAAMLLSGTALTVVGLLANGSELGLIIALFGGLILLAGLYGCCRILGIKVYAGQADWVQTHPADQSA